MQFLLHYRSLYIDPTEPNFSLLINATIVAGFVTGPLCWGMKSSTPSQDDNFTDYIKFYCFLQNISNTNTWMCISCNNRSLGEPVSNSSRDCHIHFRFNNLEQCGNPSLSTTCMGCIEGHLDSLTVIGNQIGRRTNLN